MLMDFGGWNQVESDVTRLNERLSSLIKVKVDDS